MRPLIFLFPFLLPLPCTAQVQYASVQALKDSLKSCNTAEELNAYLITNDFISEEFAIDLSAHQEDSIVFSQAGMEIDVFMKNLMGDEQQEMVIQFREQKRSWFSPLLEKAKKT